MGCAQSRLRTKISVRDVSATVKTGDLFLFSSKHAASHVTKCFTGSGWDHLGMVVKLSDSQVFILEYAGGVFLYPLFTRLYSYFAIQGREICLRRLSLPHERPEMQAQVEEFVRGVLGQKPPSIEEMVLAVLSQQSILSAFIGRLRGGGGGDDDSADGAQHAVADDLSSFFCSKLVAAMYKNLGLLSAHRSSGDFLPKHFSAEFDGYLDLQGGAMLGAEVPLSFESVQAEIDELRARAAEHGKLSPEVAVRMASRLYLGALEGLGSLGAEFGERYSSLERQFNERIASAADLSRRPDYPMWEPRPQKREEPPPPTSPAADADADAADAADDGIGSQRKFAAMRRGHSWPYTSGAQTPPRDAYPTGGAAASPVGGSGGMAIMRGDIVDELLDDQSGIYSSAAVGGRRPNPIRHGEAKAQARAPLLVGKENHDARI